LVYLFFWPERAQVRLPQPAKLEHSPGPSTESMVGLRDHARLPAKVQLDAKAGLCASRSSDRGARVPAACPRSISNPPRPFPRYWPKRLPLAHSSLPLTLADLDARANLAWLPPLGPHADMHERFAVTLARPDPIESTSPTALFAFCNHTHQPRQPRQPHTRTPPTPHHSFACPPPEVPRPAGMLRRYSPLRARHRGLRRMAARIFASAQVPSVTPGHERILPLSRHSSHPRYDTCPRPQMPRESRGISPRNGSFFRVAPRAPPPRTGPATSSKSSQSDTATGLRGDQSHPDRQKDPDDLRAAQI
jgi:hypothetical protein